jgi:hypothetical protein
LELDNLEIVKRAWRHVRRNRFLWPLAFLIALAGGGSQGFSLWVQSPILRGLTGYSPIHRIGERISDFASSHAAFWVVFISVGVIVGLGVLVFSAFAQVSAIGAVAEVDLGQKGDLRTSLRWGRHSFVRYFALIAGYLLVLAVVSFPAYVFTWAFKGGLVFPCLGWLILTVGFVVVSVLASIMLELSGRFLVLEDLGIYDSVVRAGVLLKEHWKDGVVTWLYVMVITLAGTISMAILMAILGTPLVWIFTLADRHHNAFLIALSILAFLLAWAIAAALVGVFAITASAVWTITFLELEPAAYPG